MNLQERIAKARAELEEAEPTALDVEIGGELASLTFRPVWGAEWEALVATHPPRPGATLDSNVGYNTDAVAADYPVSAITVDGGTVDKGTWRDVMAVLSSPNRKNVASVLFGLNHLLPAQKLAEAGKASKGSETK